MDCQGGRKRVDRFPSHQGGWCVSLEQHCLVGRSSRRHSRNRLRGATGQKKEVG